MLSIILLSYYSADRITLAYQKIKSILDQHSIPYEFLIMDDGSTDDSFKIAQELEKQHANVRAYQLSKNYSAHYSIFAGLELAKGNCAIPIPDDEQLPYSDIVQMYNLWKKGEKIIIPHRAERHDGFITDLFANAYYKIINSLSEVKFPKGGADSFLIDREVIDIMNSRIHAINTSSIMEVLRLGYTPYYYPYERVKGINTESRWTLKKKIRLFKDTFFSSSTWPVKMITNLGLFFAIVAFCLILLYTYVRLFGDPQFWGDIVPGWTSTIVIVSFFSGLILFSLGIIAEYIWRIYEEVKDRPGYIIKKK
ncbi:glycosyltransferase [uncultured Christiangramia sp.]|uniref:glycosyltransferase n=1 Tax=uncultured Christiangramia sp. TaxID=503836 RepID=UPI00262663C9|nr:glycosyltransferase [uncultured Christiangramia sp.]